LETAAVQKVAHHQDKLKVKQWLEVISERREKAMSNNIRLKALSKLLIL
jgi:hypothetical protein